VAHTQTDCGRIAPSSFQFRIEAASDGAKNSSSFSANSVGGKQHRFTLHTSSLFLIWNEAASIAPSHRKEEEEKQAPKGSRAAAAGTGREAQRQRSVRVAKESSESSQSRAAGRTSGHRLAGQLHSDGISYQFIKRRTTGPGENPTRSLRGRRQWRRGNADVDADGADFKQETGADGAGFEQDAGRRSRPSIQSLIGSGREATMDVWRIILAIAQVAAAAKHEEVVFNRVESAPMARFHGIGQVFQDAPDGPIVVTFDVALLQQEIKELQEGISYRRQRAPPEHRGLYDVLEENLVAGNQELEDDMDFFKKSERKEIKFGKWIAGVLGLWNVVQIHEVKRMVEGTKKGLVKEVHHKRHHAGAEGSRVWSASWVAGGHWSGSDDSSRCCLFCNTNIF
jgi:hypothetical protein